MKRSNSNDSTTPATALPRDEFSTAMRSLSDHPGSVIKQSVVELSDFYGNVVTWIAKTIRVEGDDTVFLQRQDARGADRLVLPPAVTAVLARHRDGATTVNRKRAARTNAAARKAQGIRPAFLKAKAE